MSEAVVVKTRSSGGGGCLGCLLLIIVCWALLFGVTVGGVHYGFALSCDRGVTVEAGGQR